MGAIGWQQILILMICFSVLFVIPAMIVALVVFYLVKQKASK